MHRACRAVRLVVLALTLAASVAGCASDNAEAEPYTLAPFTPAPPEPATPEPKSQALPSFDNDLNLPSPVIEELGRMADFYGYGLSPDSPLSYEQATDFAYAVSVTCEDLNSGATTLSESVQEDIRSGAPSGDARGFNRYLDGTFCPAYFGAGN